ncbi:hypothetical protein Purlil1_12081 [Purpureocillium lilacinum]|uniref:Uncharacterized protein n=1 Tax=Purpureocillium lilacinum TaxID=33203 RepID=A0ABR0BI23_PURLI|nr:hypothetical protein Purlil1_12081 [Purpureocillium lilacinum]
MPAKSHFPAATRQRNAQNSELRPVADEFQRQAPVWPGLPRSPKPRPSAGCCYAWLDSVWPMTPMPSPLGGSQRCASVANALILERGSRRHSRASPVVDVGPGRQGWVYENPDTRPGHIYEHIRRQVVLVSRAPAMPGARHEAWADLTNTSQSGVNDSSGRRGRSRGDASKRGNTTSVHGGKKSSSRRKRCGRRVLIMTRLEAEWRG